MAKKLTDIEVSLRFKNLYNGEYKLLEKYTTNDKIYELEHMKCGTRFKISKLTRFFNETSPCPCPKCRSVKVERCDVNRFKEKITENYGNLYNVISYEKMKKPVVLKCNKCNSEFKISTGSEIFLKGRFRGCPNCNPSNRGKHQVVDNYLQSVLNRSKDGNLYEWKEDYKGRNNIKHKILHKVCNKEYSVRPGDFLYGYRCPHCARMTSRTENNLFSEIKAIVPTAISSDRSQINPYELDIFIPELRLAIEYNGLYWHSEKLKGKYYHKEKMERCSLKNIHLLQVFEDEWLLKKDVILSKIRTIINPLSMKYIDITKCKITEVDLETAINFFSANDISHIPSDFYYAVYNNNEIVMMLSFNKCINDTYTITQYTTKIGYIVPNGFKSSITQIVCEKNISTLNVIADLRWYNPRANEFLEAGFSNELYMEPEMFYTDGHIRYSPDYFTDKIIIEKFPKIYNSELTIIEMLENSYLKKIWDAGKILYTKIFK